MYSTKELNKNIAKSYLSQNDPYKDPVVSKNSRVTGKQFQTNPGKDTCDGNGYFHKKSYVSDPLQDGTMYVKTQPIDQRKLGFGTHDATRRDEFMSHIRTETYRETLKREEATMEKQNEEKRKRGEDDSSDIQKTRKFPAGLTENKFLYDIGRETFTEFNQKAGRDTFYSMRTGNSKHTRDNGCFMLSSQNIGVGAQVVDRKITNGIQAATKQFYDHSHLHV